MSHEDATNVLRNDLAVVVGFGDEFTRLEDDRIPVSPKWTGPEREAVAGLLTRKLESIAEEVKRQRSTTLWEAPCFKEWQRSTDDLEFLRSMLASSSEGLEVNRRRYAEFVRPLEA